MHRDLPSETLILGLADTRKPKNTHYGACLCGNLWAPALGTHVPPTVHTLHEASHAKVTTLLWDRTATTLRRVCVSYLVVNIRKEADMPAWSTPPSGSYAHVCTPSTPSRWFYPAQEGGPRPSPSLQLQPGQPLLPFLTGPLGGSCSSAQCEHDGVAPRGSCGHAALSGGDFGPSLERFFFGLMNLTKALAFVQRVFLVRSRFLGHSQPWPPLQRSLGALQRAGISITRLGSWLLIRGSE